MLKKIVLCLLISPYMFAGDINPFEKSVKDFENDKIVSEHWLDARSTPEERIAEEDALCPHLMPPEYIKNQAFCRWVQEEQFSYENYCDVKTRIDRILSFQKSPERAIPLFALWTGVIKVAAEVETQDSFMSESLHKLVGRLQSARSYYHLKQEIEELNAMHIDSDERDAVLDQFEALRKLKPYEGNCSIDEINALRNCISLIMFDNSQG